MNDVANSTTENANTTAPVSEFFIIFDNPLPDSEDAFEEIINKLETSDILGLYGSLSENKPGKFLEPGNFLIEINRPGTPAEALSASVLELNKIFPNVKILAIEFYW